MASIDPTARIASGAEIGPDVEIGPFCVIGPHVVIGEGCRLVAQVHVAGHTTIGARTAIYPGASLGTPPQSKRYRGGPTRLVVGADCDIREGVTMNLGTEDGGGVTTVGDRGFFMVHSHIAHDCQVGNDVVFANCVPLGGHCVIGDGVVIGGLSAVHQFTRVGPNAMIGALCGVRADVIPFGLVSGDYARLCGLNIVGLKRRKIPRDRIHSLRRAYQKLFHDAGQFTDRVEQTARDFGDDDLVMQIIAFIRAGHHRPLCQPDPKRAE
jgi:UDP-N-acetylglucosamine acyltransferase